MSTRATTVVIIGIIASAVLAWISGFLVGIDYTNNRLPNCAEDEVLVSDEFPYSRVSELECMHIDDIDNERVVG